VVIGLDGGHHAVFAPDSENTLAAAAIDPAAGVQHLFAGVELFEIPDNRIASCLTYAGR
jgi:hypothetical protein